MLVYAVFALFLLTSHGIMVETHLDLSTELFQNTPIVYSGNKRASGVIPHEITLMSPPVWNGRIRPNYTRISGHTSIIHRRYT